MKDFYYILGVDVNCSAAAINEAYKKLSKKFDPHLNHGDSYFNSRFSDINEAYQVLIDPVRRYQYDADLKKSQQAATVPTTYQFSDNAVATSYTFRKSRFKGPGVGMSIVLIILALIIGVYFVKYLISTKRHLIADVPAVGNTAPKTPNRHKKKHRVKTNAVVAIAKKSMDTVKAEKAPVTISKPIQLGNIKPVATSKAEPINKKAIIENNNPAVNSKQVLLADKVDNDAVLYITTVRPNATGIVNMREGDQYNSAVIQHVPPNAKISVLAKGSYYYKVSFNKMVGYIPKWSLEVK